MIDIPKEIHLFKKTLKRKSAPEELEFFYLAHEGKSSKSTAKSWARHNHLSINDWLVTAQESLLDGGDEQPLKTFRYDHDFLDVKMVPCNFYSKKVEFSLVFPEYGKFHHHPISSRTIHSILKYSTIENGIIKTPLRLILEPKIEFRAANDAEYLSELNNFLLLDERNRLSKSEHKIGHAYRESEDGPIYIYLGDYNTIDHGLKVKNYSFLITSYDKDINKKIIDMMSLNQKIDCNFLLSSDKFHLSSMSKISFKRHVGKVCQPDEIEKYLLSKKEKETAELIASGNIAYPDSTFTLSKGKIKISEKLKNNTVMKYSYYSGRNDLNTLQKFHEALNGFDIEYTKDVEL